MSKENEQTIFTSHGKPRERTLLLIGAISSVFSLIPWLLFWGMVIPYIVRCDYSSVDLDDLLIFIFCGIPLIILCAIFGGLLGIGIGNVFFSRWLKPTQAKLGAMLGGFLAAFLLALSMMVFLYNPLTFCV